MKQDDWASWIFPRIRDEKMYRSVEQGPPFFRTFARTRVSSVTFDNFPSRTVRPRLSRVKYERKCVESVQSSEQFVVVWEETIFLSLSKSFAWTANQNFQFLISIIVISNSKHYNLQRFIYKFKKLSNTMDTQTF